MVRDKKVFLKRVAPVLEVTSYLLYAICQMRKFSPDFFGQGIVKFSQIMPPLLNTTRQGVNQLQSQLD